ncbi:MAG: hypothetical protein ABIT37_14820 [Luteolibacter sp.]
MNPLPTEIPPSPTIEQGINSLLTDAKSKVRSTSEHYRERVRQSPGTAVLAAVAAGYCLHRLPVRSLLVSQVRLMAALAPPALLAIGAAKLCEFLQKQVREKPKVAPMLRHAGELHGDL